MSSKPRPTKQIGLRLSPEMLAWLTATAKADDRSVPYIIKRLIADEMAREAKLKTAKPKAKD